MSEIMKPMPFKNLMTWIIEENKNFGTIFNTKKYYKANRNLHFAIYDERIETPIGPAAGPNSQLAQNIITSYVAGARFFELKTVQQMAGAELAACVNKPCILASDECYNCEWSTELSLPEARDEYIKAWVALKVISKEFDLGSPDGFVFNMSVGYDLEGIKTERVDNVIECLKDANKAEIFAECKNWLKRNISMFKNIDEAYVDSINPVVSTSVTESTLHGCPPAEIEKIATYLMEEKGLNTFIKCNPTLLGYERARRILDEMGYDYVAFTDSHFKGDMQYNDCIAMLKRLKKLAEEKELTFGVKLTNTFPVDVTRNELPSEEMYMSGKSLFALSLNVAKLLAHDMEGELMISYSGGADYFNIDKLIECGIWPVTVATTILKPGGYDRFYQMANLIMDKVKTPVGFEKINLHKLDTLVEETKTDKHLIKKKRFKVNKVKGNQPLLNCFIAPCSDTCPIHQDISLYNYYVKQKQFDKALSVIYRTNPLPFMTGNLCPHPCTTGCERNHYDEPVKIRENKLLAARSAYDEVLKNMKPALNNGKTVAIVGAGPAGIAAAHLLAKAGTDVTVFDENDKAGGTVANIIPTFRINPDEIKKDVAAAEALGAKFVYNTKITDLSELQSKFNYVILAIGAHKETPLSLKKGEAMNAHHFLKEFNKTNGNVDIGEKVVVIGAGNTAMDSARAAIKNKNVKEVSLVYRRTIDEMPADLEELELALADGVEFMPLLSPISFGGGRLELQEMKLGPAGPDGRRSVIETNEKKEIHADTIIASIGEKVDGEFYKSLGIEVNEKGCPIVNESLETNINKVYAIGDGAKGASIIVKAIADAKIVAKAILGISFGDNELPDIKEKELYDNRANLSEPDVENDGKRCLNCNYICEVCNEVCPNRANVHVVLKDGRHEVIHIDAMCNECGNCTVFCPYEGAPYKEKWTLFSDSEAMDDSTNNGFYYKNENHAHVRIFGNEFDYELGTKDDRLGALAEVIDIVKEKYSYYIY